MMLPIIFINLWLALILPGVAGSQDAGRSVTGEEKAIFLHTWGTRMQDMRTLHMLFTQEKHLTLLRRPLVTQGELWLKGDTLRYTLKNPGGTTELDLRLDPHTVRAYYPLLQTLEVIDLGATPTPQHAVPFLSRDFANAEDVYDTELTGAAERYTLRLVPRHANSPVAALQLTLQQFQPVEYIQTEKNGNRLVMHISTFTMNPDVSDAQLDLQVPAGTTVTYPLR